MELASQRATRTQSSGTQKRRRRVTRRRRDFLGECYHKGEGVVQNFKLAVKWYTKAAEQNHTKAMINLGNAYKHGEGVKCDGVFAVKWYTKAIEQDDKYNALAYFNLGLCYKDGVCVDKDLWYAMEMFRKADEKGHKDAQQHMDEIKLPEPPTFFKCAITRDILKDPVCAPDGYTYERGDIEKWLSRQHNSPFTREPMSTKQLNPNRQLKEAIEDWKKNLK